ncbi:uncharacterized protein BJ171DRAFT_542395 [Polychytrium aggregatum]|uniref:uncharacterized protein n=1 Tax=Polychytrium aggregatum TaxID=110093 RepID=UPI0022FEFA97|nr:uncharacterized protein BJ171DRAFT_542395 [Polychytrium aggregatum]KAI9190674.1 hypothetical protein BJ171DRAFT_542395 [Polychytrium aggregatum]
MTIAAHSFIFLVVQESAMGTLLKDKVEIIEARKVGDDHLERVLCELDRAVVGEHEVVSLASTRVGHIALVWGGLLQVLVQCRDKAHERELDIGREQEVVSLCVLIR